MLFFYHERRHDTDNICTCIYKYETVCKSLIYYISYRTVKLKSLNKTYASVIDDLTVLCC